VIDEAEKREEDETAASRRNLHFSNGFT